ncbi:DUF6479 family protein [Streptomyces sp. 549]|uniref:DUF6479 family protein n=1 Tax=Streptomyces sp. 549 TaxID=3049076 RepID=UPI0024C2A4E9|nr:DUF6479 family protein [Streptomyces sp. 549]MDK1475970.1 DUF6479 family protein [Streptomyces sp. 549]
MNEILAQERDLLVGIGPFLAGIGVVTVLILAVWLGVRQVRRGRRISRPAADPPPSRPVGYETGPTDDVEVPRDGQRRSPHGLGDHGSAGEGMPERRDPGH